MPGKSTRSSRKAWASCLLVFLQLHLLGVAMLHRHGEAVGPSSGLCVQGRETQPSSTSESGIPCAVCQIVHSGAARPAPAAQILSPVILVSWVWRLAPGGYRSVLPAMSYGRAPPLS